MDRLGIDIGTVSVKWVRWRGRRERGRIISSADCPYKSDWEDLQRILSEIRAAEGGDMEVAVALTSPEILKKTFTIPLLPENELKEALVWATSKAIATPLEEMVYENVMVGQVDERGVRKDEVLFVGAARALADKVLATCNHAGFRKVRTITDASLLYPSFVPADAGESVAVIDMGGRQTGIYIIEGKKLRFAREIMTASESFSDALMAGLKLSYEEAESYKREKGLNQESEHILSLPIERLTGEIQRTFSVYAQRYPEKPVKKIYVSGRGVRVPGLVSRLRERVGEGIEALEPPEGLGDAFLLPYLLCTEKQRLVNLMPEKVQEKEQEEAQKKWVRIGSISVFAVLAVLSLNLLSNLSRVRGAVSAEQTLVSKKKEQIGTINLSALSRYNDLRPGLREVQKKDHAFLVLLRYLSSRLPPDVYLKEIEFAKYGKLKTASEFQKPAPAAAKEEAGGKDVLKNTLREILHPATAVKEEGAKKDGPREATAQPKEGSRMRFVTLTGYITGDADAQELILLDVIIGLEKSGLGRDVELTGKQVREMGGKKVMEFTVEFRCEPYEV